MHALKRTLVLLATVAVAACGGGSDTEPPSQPPTQGQPPPTFPAPSPSPTPAPAPVPSPSPSPSPPSGDACESVDTSLRRVLLMVLHYCTSTAGGGCTGRQASAVGKSAFVDLMWSGPTSIDQLYRSSSYGKVGFAPVGTGKACSVALEMNLQLGPTGELSVADAERQANEIARAVHGVDPDLAAPQSVLGFHHRMYVHPRRAGLFATAGGNATRYFYEVDRDPVAVAHELGHNFGMNHSNRTPDEVEPPLVYQDVSDPMGFGGQPLRGFHALHRYQVGWLDATQVVDPFAAGLSGQPITLFPLDVQPSEVPAGAGRQVIRFRQARQTDSANHYFVSFRSNEDTAGRQITFANMAPEYLGVNIHVSNRPSETAAGDASNHIVTLTPARPVHTLKDGTTVRVLGFDAARNTYTVTVSR